MGTLRLEKELALSSFKIYPIALILVCQRSRDLIFILLSFLLMLYNSSYSSAVMILRQLFALRIFWSSFSTFFLPLVLLVGDFVLFVISGHPNRFVRSASLEYSNYGKTSV